MGVVYFSIIPTFEPSRYCKCWIVCFYNIIKNKEKLISFIDELNYEKYHRLITEKILNNINENVKILY